MHLGHLIGLEYVTAGVVVATVASAFAAWGLYRLARGGVGGAVAVLFWSFAPVAVFSVVPYTEAPFLAFAVWAWVKARDGRWRQAGLLAAAACLFRVSGLFLLGALVLLVVFGDDRASDRWTPQGVVRRFKWLALPVGALALWSLFLRIHYGSWFAWFEAQQAGWPREFRWPWQALQTTLDQVRGHDVNWWIFQGEVVAVVVGLVVVVVCLFRWRVPEAGFMGVSVGVLAFQLWFMSVARNSLLWFPLYTTLGDVAAARTRGFLWWLRYVVLGALLAASAIVMVVWAFRYYNGAWAG
jgi:hypothetical protein